MKHSILMILAAMLLLLASCSTKDLSGVYECQSLKGTGVGAKDRVIDALSDGSCTYSQLEFKADSTIVLTGKDRTLTATYTRNDDIIRVKDGQTEILFEIRIDKTIKGEGVTKGIYKKY